MGSLIPQGLTPVMDIPQGSMELALHRTEPLVRAIGYFAVRNRVQRTGGDALHDALASAYLQGCNDTATALHNRGWLPPADGEGE